MLEKDMIQSYGFKNVSAGDQVTGFQVRIRIPYYRGVWASLVEGADLTVDGEEFSRDTILWTLGDKTFTLPELEAASDVRWPFDEPAVLTVPKAGGLAVGLHDIRVQAGLPSLVHAARHGALDHTHREKARVDSLTEPITARETTMTAHIQARRDPVQLHRRLRGHHDPRGLHRRRSRCRRAGHRDPGRDARPGLPEPHRRLGGPLARTDGQVWRRADLLWLLDRFEIAQRSHLERAGVPRLPAEGHEHRQPLGVQDHQTQAGRGDR